ncbi:MAG: fatty acid CoA ligase family protein [Planctomycetota bacterium]|nr:fatty acid CoA ligase family protein [Planctomycetota bacterium]
MPDQVNIAERLRESARLFPHQKAVIFPAGRDSRGRVSYTHLTFAQLDDESDRLAQGLIDYGVQPGHRLVLMVRPSLEFIALTFALFKTGAVAVLIDPGMGRSNIFDCLETVEPDGFVAIPIVQAVRAVNRRKFRNARFNVTVGGRRWFWGGTTYEELAATSSKGFESARTQATDPAAIIFTSGSTGPQKGVAYEHGMFDAQVELLRDFYGIKPGEVDLPGFPLFALFNSAMGVTTVIPDMDPTKPAQVDPLLILEAIRDHGVTQAFGSPAIWNRIGRHCEATGEKLGSLKRVLSAGAPVPIHVLDRMLKSFAHEDANIHTPYGATESLPVASISGREVLSETAARSRQGAGTCVGRLFPRVQVRIIEITDGPIEHVNKARELPRGEIGEILVQAPSTTREYFRRPDATALAKVPDDDGRFWHRMGDVGWFDDDDRLWFCGRKAHIVEAASGRMFTIPCEAIFNEHPRVFRSALVGVGESSAQKPVIIVEPEAGHFPESPAVEQKFRGELLSLGKASSLTESIETVLFHRSLPVDIRHNVKIFREKLAPWAEEQLRK